MSQVHAIVGHTVSTEQEVEVTVRQWEERAQTDHKNDDSVVMTRVSSISEPRFQCTFSQLYHLLQQRNMSLPSSICSLWQVTSYFISPSLCLLVEVCSVRMFLIQLKIHCGAKPVFYNGFPGLYLMPENGLEGFLAKSRSENSGKGTCH